MNERNLGYRYYQIIALIALLFVALCIRLFVLSIIQEKKWSEAAKSQNTKEIVVSAPRGEILDRYGRVLADNKQIFSVMFNVSGMKTAEINRSAYEVVKLLEKNGDKYVNNFPIVITATGQFKYKFDIDKVKYLRSLGLNSRAKAEDVLAALRAKYEIDMTLNRYEAVKVLQEKYGVWPSINIGSMTFIYDSKKALFLDKYGLAKEKMNPKTKKLEKDYNISAEKAFKDLRKTYGLDKPIEEGEGILSDRTVRKIFNIREEIKNTGFNRYRSSTIAKDVSDETVAYVSEMGNLLKGVEITSDTVRIYPNKNLASHILGYMGSIADTQYDKYVKELGYSADDLVGKDGIESTMESYLRGKDGVKTILVNSSGDYMETIGETNPVAGKNIYLTIDKDLQKVAEDALEKAVLTTKTGTVFTSKYGNLRQKQFSHCGSGAVVAIDVETAEVLAMASYPDYDPNRFAEGISSKDWAAVQSKNPRDYLAPTPLYNNATQASVQPGSTFKPITAVAALQCGLNPYLNIRDKGHIIVGNRSFGCSAWNEYRGTHGIENLATGIQNSCNYYFYCIASGKDWTTGGSLGYKKKITIEKIMKVAKEFGLGQKTGIELNEATTTLASAKKKMENTKNSLKYYLYVNAAKFWNSKVYNDEDALAKDIEMIVNWTEEDPSRGDIINRLSSDSKVKKNKIETLTDICKYSYYMLAQWTIGDTFNLSIGQGDNAYTPLQMANYVATLGNDGKRNQVSIVKGVEDNEKAKKSKAYQIKVNKNELATVIEGMKLVTKRGTLAGCFSRFPINVAGKTGTAEKDGKINPKDEVQYIKDHLGAIAPDISWERIRNKMNKLMKDDPKRYPDENSAVDDALIKVSNKRVTINQINRYKGDYDNFAWTIAMAPAENPKIAVVVLLVQGGISTNAAPVAREIIGEYLNVQGQETKTKKLNLSTTIN